jgi:hypothetical protein
MRNVIRKIMEECHRHSPEKHESIRTIVRKMGDTIRQEMLQYQQVFSIKRKLFYLN